MVEIIPVFPSSSPSSFSSSLSSQVPPLARENNRARRGSRGDRARGRERERERDFAMRGQKQKPLFSFFFQFAPPTAPPTRFFFSAEPFQLSREDEEWRGVRETERLFFCERVKEKRTTRRRRHSCEKLKSQKKTKTNKQTSPYYHSSFTKKKKRNARQRERERERILLLRSRERERESSERGF